MVEVEYIKATEKTLYWRLWIDFSKVTIFSFEFVNLNTGTKQRCHHRTNGEVHSILDLQYVTRV